MQTDIIWSCNYYIYIVYTLLNKPNPRTELERLSVSK
jgi:hypothetical protein